MHGRHLTLFDREVFAQLRAQGCSQAEVPRQVGCHPSTIGRELTRNHRADAGYFASWAQGCADQRRRAGKRPWKLEGGPIEDYVRDRLGQYWSAEAVIASASTNRWRADHLAP